MSRWKSTKKEKSLRDASICARKTKCQNLLKPSLAVDVPQLNILQRYFYAIMCYNDVLYDIFS